MEQRPIIIKRIKKHGHAHHGGSWKVAYADFVTAMMAFFLLMWLMGFTTEGERKAISDYFQNPSAIQGKGGSSTSLIDMGKGMDSPRSAQKKPNQDTTSVNVEDVNSEAPGQSLSVSEDSKKLLTEADKKRLESLMEELKQAIEASQALKPFKDQLFIDITSEGLRIQIVDKENRPMFDVGSANLQSYTRGILREISKTIAAVPNRISIAGHTDARGYAAGAEYTNWELSTDRANACRRELVSGGVVDEKIARVVGLASTALFDKANPLSPINRRISIVVLNRETEEAMMKKEENEKHIESDALVTAETVGATVETGQPVVAAPTLAPEPAKPVEPAPVVKPQPVKPAEPAPIKPVEVTPAKPVAPLAPPAAKMSDVPASSSVKSVAAPATAPASTSDAPKVKAKPVASVPAKTDATAPPTKPASEVRLPAIAPAIQLPGLPITTPATGGFAPPPKPATDPSKPKP